MASAGDASTVLLSAAAVRERCEIVFAAAERGQPQRSPARFSLGKDI